MSKAVIHHLLERTSHPVLILASQIFWGLCIAHPLRGFLGCSIPSLPPHATVTNKGSENRATFRGAHTKPADHDPTDDEHLANSLSAYFCSVEKVYLCMHIVVSYGVPTPERQSTKFKFVINLQTAEALRLELLARADEVIERPAVKNQRKLTRLPPIAARLFGLALALGLLAVVTPLLASFLAVVTPLLAVVTPLLAPLLAILAPLLTALHTGRLRLST